MTDGWFAGVGADERAAAECIQEGSADASADWPALAVASGFATDEAEYYARLHAAAVRAARDAAADRERADDRQVIHAVRAMDDTRRMANELAERVAEWAASRHPDAGAGVEYCRTLVADGADGAGKPSADDRSAADDRLLALAERVVALDEEATALETFVEQGVREATPNLAALAGPTLAARLLALAGGLESLARTSSSTVQVLGAEDALFAHLRGAAPSPKHGVIYTHEYVRDTHPDERGSAARALAGKLTIAARIDHYAGDRRPELDHELTARIETIRARHDGRTDDGAS